MKFFPLPAIGRNAIVRGTARGPAQDPVGRPEASCSFLKSAHLLRQDANTFEMIFGIPEIIERWSWLTLEPGDVVATGAPAAAAVEGEDPFLRAGDVMECTIERLGTLRNSVVAEKS